MVNYVRTGFPATRNVSRSGRVPGDTVGVTSGCELRGYARYLQAVNETRMPDGSVRSTYTYGIPRRALNEALRSLAAPV